MIKKTIKVDDNSYYGMGLFITKKNNQNLMWHSGMTNSFLSMLYIYPDLELRIFVVINTNDVICRQPANDLFYNIEIINECMNKGKRVEFDYFSYDSSGKPVERMKGYTFYVSPYYLVNNYGKYYLICHYRDKYGPISIFKLDHMMNVRISDKDLVPLNKLEPPVEDFSIADFINSHVYIFSTKVIDSKLKLNNLASNDAIVDWFGKKAKLYEENGVTYAKVRSDEEGLIYWLLQYGDLVQVEEPKELKDKVVEKLKRILCKYEE
jgi:predicted DNA-binding transcriptional regulator YafY